MTARLSLSGTLILLLLAAACASSGGGEAQYRSDEITRDEIMSADVTNLYDVVKRLRPRWLTAERRAGDRSFGLSTGVMVFQNQTLLGEIEVLRQWSPSAAYKLEWMDGAEAAASLPGLGASHVAGAIIIRTAPER